MAFRMHMKSYLAAGAIFAALVSGTTAVAYAQDHGASITGSNTFSMSKTIYVQDTASDSQWVRGEWNSASGSGGLNNKSGASTTVSKATGVDITAVRSCKSQTLHPLTCSSWNSDY